MNPISGVAHCVEKKIDLHAWADSQPLSPGSLIKISLAIRHFCVLRRSILSKMRKR